MLGHEQASEAIRDSRRMPHSTEQLLYRHPLGLWLTYRPKPAKVLTAEEIAACRQEIESVLQQVGRVNEQVLAPHAKKNVVQKAIDQAEVLERYVNGLYPIDTSRCPEDFQQAFLRMLRALDRMKNFYKARGTADVVGIISSDIWGGLKTMGKLSAEEQALHKELNEATTDLRLAGKRHHVKGI